MPLDVLSKIQRFAKGGEVQNIANMVNNNPSLEQAFNGIASAATNGGVNINSESIAKTEALMNAFVKATKEADMSMMGLGNSIKTINSKPLETAEATVRQIAENGRNIVVSVSIDKAQASLKSLADKLERLRVGATVSVNVSSPVSRPLPKPQKFATGGRVTYHKQNTETAQTGGIFRKGSSVGDKNLIFANKGEGIITERAMRQGAKQRGISPEMYIQALNNPSTNLPRIKKGRSFAFGGTVSGSSIPDYINDRLSLLKNNLNKYVSTTESGGISKTNLEKIFDSFPDYDETNEEIKKIYEDVHKYLMNMPSSITGDEGLTKLESLFSELVKQFRDKEGKKELDALKEAISEGLKKGFDGLHLTANIEKLIRLSMKNEDESHGEKKKRYGKIKQVAKLSENNRAYGSAFEELIKQGNSRGDIAFKSSAEMLTKMETSGLDDKELEKIEKYCDAVLEMQKHINDAEEKIKSFGDAWKRLNKISQYELRNELTDIPLIGKAFDGNVVGVMAYVAAVTIGIKKLNELLKTTSEFVGEQAKISKNFTLVSQSINTFSGSAQNFDAMRTVLNLTREQAVGLGEAMKDVAVKGVHGVDTVNTIALNLKNALGEVDVSKLKEATQLINDLPKEQVDVMLHGTGSFDDKANLIANLMNDGNLEKTIDLMMNGAFGKQEGSVNLSEKDKAVINAQNEANLLLDDIKSGIYTMIPKFGIGVIAKWTKMLAIASKATATISILYKIYKELRELKRKASEKNEKGEGGGEGEGKGGEEVKKEGNKFSEKVKEAFKNPKKAFEKIKNLGMKDGKFSFKTFAGKGWGKTKSLASKGWTAKGAASGAVAGAIVFAVSAAIAKGFKYYADRKRKEKDVKYQQERNENIAKYGVSVGRENTEIRDAEAGAKNAADLALGFGALAAAVVATGVAFGAFTAGISTVVGVLAAAGIALAGFAFDNLKDDSSFTHQEKRGWYNPARWFGDTFTAELDKDATERLEYYKESLDKLDAIAKSEGRKTNSGMLKELIVLNKHVKAIDMIVKGRLTAYDENSFATNMSLMKQFATVGGTNAGYASTRQMAFAENARSYATQSRAMSEQKMRIMTSGKMGSEAQANGLNKAIQEETKMHQKFIDNMKSVIDTLGETPTIIVDNLRQQMHDMLNNFASGGFVANGRLVADDARNDTASISRNIGTIMEDSFKNSTNIDNTIRMISQNTDVAKMQLEMLKQNTGIKSEDEARQINNEISEKLRATAGSSVEYMATLDGLSEIVTKASDARASGDETTMDSVAAELKTNLTRTIAELTEARDNAKAEGNNKLAQEFTAQIGKLSGMKKSIEDDDKGMTSQKVLDIFKGLAASATEQKAVMEKNKEAIGKLSEEERKRLGEARTFESLQRAVNSLVDTKVAQQNLKSVDVEKFVKKVEEQSNRFMTSLTNVLNNGSVQFANAIKGALEKSEEYDLFGGAQAALNVSQAGLKELDESLSALKEAQSIVNDNNDISEFERKISEYFQEKNKVATEEIGNQAERESVEVEKSIYDEIRAIREKMIDDKKNEEINKADEDLGKKLKSMTGNFSQWYDVDAKKFGFDSASIMQSMTAEELGKRFRVQEENRVRWLVEQMKKDPEVQQLLQEGKQTEKDLETEARRVTRDRQKNLLGDNSTWLAPKEKYLRQQYEAIMSENRSRVRIAGKEATNSKSELDKKDFSDMEALYNEAVEKRLGKIDETVREQMSTETGQKYIKLMANTARAQKKLMANPQNANARHNFEMAENDQKKFERENFGQELDEDTRNALKKMGVAMAALNKGSEKIMQADADWKQKFMSQFNKIPTLLEKIVMNSGRSLSLGARQGALESMQTTMGEYNNVGRSIAMRGRVRMNAGALLQSRLANLDKDEYVKSVERQGREAIELAKSKPGTTPEQIANMEIALQSKIVQAKYEVEKKAKDEYVKSLQQSMKSLMDEIAAQEESFGIQKDLFETIGAPFEYILDVEQNMVRLAKDKAAAEEEILIDMQKRGIHGLELERQKNKVAKASAEVIKASFGAQRDALDKLLGKMMGGFEQIGGIFGPDSDFMKARKAGQGYTQLPSGMISASGGTVTNYADRVQGLRLSGADVKMRRGEASIFGFGKAIPFDKEPGRYDDRSGLGGKFAEKSKKQVVKGNKYEGMSGEDAVNKELKQSAFGGVAEKTEQVSNTDELLEKILADTNEIVRILSNFTGFSSSNASTSPSTATPKQEETVKSSENKPSESNPKSTPKQEEPKKEEPKKEEPKKEETVKSSANSQPESNLKSAPVQEEPKKELTEEEKREYNNKLWEQMTDEEEKDYQEMDRLYKKGKISKDALKKLHVGIKKRIEKRIQQQQQQEEQLIQESDKSYESQKVTGEQQLQEDLDEENRMMQEQMAEEKKAKKSKKSQPKQNKPESEPVKISVDDLLKQHLNKQKRRANPRLSLNDMRANSHILALNKGNQSQGWRGKALDKVEQETKQMAQERQERAELKKKADAGDADAKKQLADIEAKEKAEMEEYKKKEAIRQEEEKAKKAAEEAELNELRKKEEEKKKAEQEEKDRVAKMSPEERQKYYEKKAKDEYDADMKAFNEKVKARKEAEADVNAKVDKQNKENGARAIIRNANYKDIKQLMNDKRGKQKDKDEVIDYIKSTMSEEEVTELEGLMKNKQAYYDMLQAHADNLGLFDSYIKPSKTAFASSKKQVKSSPKQEDNVKAPDTPQEGVKKAGSEPVQAPVPQQPVQAPQGNVVQQGANASTATNRQSMSTGNASLNAATQEANRLQAQAEKKQEQNTPVSSQAKKQGEKGSGDMRVKVDVSITMNSDMFKAEVKKIVNSVVPETLVKNGQGIGNGAPKA